MTEIERLYAWQSDAACRDYPTAWFFPIRGEVISTPVKLICERCPVRVDCLTWALTHYERYGVWGGYGWTQLRYYRTHRRCGYCGDRLTAREMAGYVIGEVAPRFRYCADCRERRSLERAS